MSSAHERPAAYQLLVVADAAPEVLARVAEAVLTTNRLPSVATLVQDAQGRAEIVIELRDVTADAVARVARAVSRSTSVRDISTFEFPDPGTPSAPAP